MKLNLFYTLMITLLFGGCISTNNSVKSSSKNNTNRRSLPEVVVSIDDNDGNFKPLEIDKEEIPEPIQGKNQWTRDFYSSIRYPAIARERGIGGIVILDIAIDQNGKVTDVGIKQGISKECDEEAKRAYLKSTKGGYTPLIINGKPVKFRLEMPVGFWLE